MLNLLSAPQRFRTYKAKDVTIMNPDIKKFLVAYEENPTQDTLARNAAKVAAMINTRSFQPQEALNELQGEALDHYSDVITELANLLDHTGESKMYKNVLRVLGKVSPKNLLPHAPKVVNMLDYTEEPSEHNGYYGGELVQIEALKTLRKLPPANLADYASNVANKTNDTRPDVRVNALQTLEKLDVNNLKNYVLNVVERLNDDDQIYGVRETAETVLKKLHDVELKLDVVKNVLNVLTKLNQPYRAFEGFRFLGTVPLSSKYVMQVASLFERDDDFWHTCAFAFLKKIDKAAVATYAAELVELIPKAKVNRYDIINLVVDELAQNSRAVGQVVKKLRHQDDSVKLAAKDMLEQLPLSALAPHAEELERQVPEQHATNVLLSLKFKNAERENVVPHTQAYIKLLENDDYADDAESMLAKLKVEDLKKHKKALRKMNNHRANNLLQIIKYYEEVLNPAALPAPVDPTRTGT